MKVHDVAFFNVMFTDGPGSKPRPALILEKNGAVIKFYKITSKYKSLSSIFSKEKI